jgi:hypothetical protein
MDSGVRPINRELSREESHGRAEAVRQPFEITKWEVWEAYRQVKANRGVPGVDGVTIEEFDKDLKAT